MRAVARRPAAALAAVSSRVGAGASVVGVDALGWTYDTGDQLVLSPGLWDGTSALDNTGGDRTRLRTCLVGSQLEVSPPASGWSTPCVSSAT